MSAVDVLAVATHRYPTEILWGLDYADGFRHVVADNDSDALQIARSKGAAVEMSNMQRRIDSSWEFCA